MKCCSIILPALLVLAASTAARATDFAVPLNCNWNGMVHPGETGQPDRIDGFRSISDRALYINAANANALGTSAIIGATGIHYTIITAADTLDIVHLGNTGPGTNRTWDAAANGDNHGIQPTWLAGLSAHLVPQVTTLAAPVTLDGNSSIGVLYNVSNGGGTFDMLLTFTDASTSTVTLGAADWFGAVNPPTAAAGVASQTRLNNATYTAASNVDLPAIQTFPTQSLAVTDAVITVQSLALAGRGNVIGKQLASITFKNPSATGNGYAIYAATVVYGLPTPANDDCANATVVSAGATVTDNFRATGATTSPCGAFDTTDVWFRYAAAATGLLEARTCGAAFDTTLGIHAVCGGPSIVCDDNGCTLASRVRWNAMTGRTYFIRVAGNNAATGAFTLFIDTNPVPHTDITLPLDYNWNGMVHVGETGQPDAPGGYRSISDKGLYVSGAAGAINHGTLVDADFLPFQIINQAGVLDIVHLGKTGPGSVRLWDAATNANNRGIQPAWLTALDQSVPQRTSLGALNLAMGPDTQIGVIYNVSNNGATFNATLEFADASTATVTLAGPDWVGNLAPAPPTAGVAVQRQLGLFAAAQSQDAAALNGPSLNVAEAVFSTSSLLAGGRGNVSGKTLAALTFSGPNATTNGVAIYAATLRDPVFLAGPLPPTGTGAALPNPVAAGGTLRLTVNVLPGSNPASTGLAVTADLSAFGGSATQPLTDDGAQGDLTPGDMAYSHALALPSTQTAGAYAIAFTISDAQARSLTGLLNLSVVPSAWDESADGGGDAGSLPTTAQAIPGAGPLAGIRGILGVNDVDMYRIHVCNPAAFSASTVNADTSIDTQLFLFHPDGAGVASNDDAPAGGVTQSRLTGAFVTAPGNYDLAITQYNKDPLDAGESLLWSNTPYTTERAPDGPAATHAVADWTNTGATGGAYLIQLTGVCFGSAPCMNGDMNGDAHVDGDDVPRFVQCLLDDAGANCGCGDGNATGLVDANDVSLFVYALLH